MLTGEPGKGDPLAHSRLTTQCTAEPIEHGHRFHERIRTRFLDRHPKANLYIDFPDFLFFRLKPEQASLNAGFGRAYHLDGGDLIIQSPAIEEIAAKAAETVRDLVERHPDVAETLAARLKAPKSASWRICGIDPAGFEIISGDFLLRYEFETPAVDSDHICSNISKIAYSIP
ncbi:putative heme iron utilization protein [Rhizobium sp. BK049]|nr:putative heme iron utilization protein [Rhizobium sp. BK049]